eukprot:337928-Lingulodinium_polyedra.AAC.1
MARSMKEQARAQGRPLSTASYQQVCRVHGRAWAQLTFERQEEYEAEARAFAEERADALQVLIADTAARLGEVRAQHEAHLEANPFKPLLFSTCTLTELDIQEWQEQHEALKESRNQVRAMRRAAMEAPALPTEDEVEALGQLPVGDAEDPGARRP